MFNLEVFKNIIIIKEIKKIFRFLNISTDEVFGSLNKDDKPFVENQNTILTAHILQLKF